MLIQWSPELSLLYIIENKQGHGIKEINAHVIKIEDEKLRYAVVRKILRLLRNKSKDILNQTESEVGKILKASIIELHNPGLESLAAQLV